MTTAQPISRLSDAILDMAGDQHRLGVMSDNDYRQITFRHPGEFPVPTAWPIQGDDLLEG